MGQCRSTRMCGLGVPALMASVDSRNVCSDFVTSCSQQIVKQTRVFQGQHIEFVRQGEHDMEIAGVEEFAFACRQSPLAGLRLTLGAVPTNGSNTKTLLE